jgi:hypothetical protein
MRPTVFVHTNAKQIVGAIVSAHSLKRNASKPELFDVQIIRREDYRFFDEFEGRPFLRGGGRRIWTNSDLQSFTPCRFMPPKLMNYDGRAIVIDPDVFAVGDIGELLSRDMRGKAILARPRPGYNGRHDYVATSAMLLDCAQLTHWDVRRSFEELFAFKLDYEDWITLACEPEGSIGHLEPEWNDFDKLTPSTKLLHNTKRRSQPWKTGLPVDFTTKIPLPFADKILGTSGIRLPLKYRPHPDRRQEQLFFALLRECIENGMVTEDMLRREMAANHVRHDALDVVKRVPPLEAVLDRSTPVPA